MILCGLTNLISSGGFSPIPEIFEDVGTSVVPEMFEDMETSVAHAKPLNQYPESLNKVEEPATSELSSHDTLKNVSIATE